MSSSIRLVTGILTFTLLTACGGGGNIGSSSTGDSASKVTYQVNDATSSSSISWTAPTTYEDGSPLSPAELGGYKVYVGSSETSYSVNYTTTDIAKTNFNFSELGKGLKFLYVTSFDINGNESRLSDPVVVNIT
jgi:hypothetical protein